MTKKMVSALIVSLGLSVSGFAADVVYQASVKEITAHALFDQQIEQSGLITVKPEVFSEAKGDIQALEQCLWSVLVTLDAGQANFSAGKMICIGPEQEVLETIPMGEVALQGQCADTSCSVYNVTVDSLVTMSLTAPIEFTVQPRNERQ
ncbi:hypothetical protein [Reinekea sp.]|jgi:hypothetical protein|uniref:hypothetical protein n=1 Tax=Reinekea sp. TaxID=1970455 RepID=UPI003988B48D